MNVSELIGMRVHIFVSDPWEFGTECGVGPFAAVVSSAQSDLLLLRLEVPIEHRGARLKAVLARPRHAPGTVERLVSDGYLATNLAFLRRAIGAMSEVTDDAKAGMVPAVGSIETTNH